MNTHKEVIDFLDEIIDNLRRLGMLSTDSFRTKLSYIEKMRAIMERRDLPSLESNNDWCYQLQFTMSSFYLNMVLTEEAQKLRPKMYGYNLIKLSGKFLTVDDYAKSKGITIDTVRKQLRTGQLPYAKKFGSAWLIPAFSHPVKDEKLSGWFEVSDTLAPYVTSDGVEIIIPKNSAISVLPKKRGSDNKKMFSVDVSVSDYSIQIPTKTVSYEITSAEKNKFLFFLISNPCVGYHSSDIGLAEWLYD